MHARNPEDLIRLIFSSESPTSLAYRFRSTLWKKRNLSLLVSDITYLGPNGLIPDGLQVCPGRPRGLKLENDT